MLRNHWKKVARTFASVIYSRADLKPALAACQSLLGFFERLNLTIFRDLSESISREEWWDAFTEQCYTKYPYGPTQLGLWERSGGKNYDLYRTATGRDIWVDAISKIKDGRSMVNCKKLIHEMLNDYTASDELIKLKKTVGKYEK